MKELIYIMFTILLVIGCGHSKPAEERQHVFHTYYGDIDIDTIPPVQGDDGRSFYLVNVEKADTAITKAIGLEGAYFVYVYEPSDSAYYMKLIGSDGGYSDWILCDPDEIDRGWEKWYNACYGKYQANNHKIIEEITTEYADTDSVYRYYGYYKIVTRKFNYTYEDSTTIKLVDIDEKHWIDCFINEYGDTIKKVYVDGTNYPRREED